MPPNSGPPLCLAQRGGSTRARDGRLAVAALGDGTIRWYRADNSQELLALMVTEDTQRWVTFMPSGYYAAGPGSEGT